MKKELEAIQNRYVAMIELIVELIPFNYKVKNLLDRMTVEMYSAMRKHAENK